MPLTISDLRQRPEFFDRGDAHLEAWWQASGTPLAYISGRLRENLEVTPIPFALVAHDGGAFLGTSSVIARPRRAAAADAMGRRGVGRGTGAAARRRRRLVDRAAQDCFALGVGRIYLCARPGRGFYQGLGWTASNNSARTR